jgi:hypothetical protein
MPPVIRKRDDFLYEVIRGHRRQLRILGSQQQNVLTTGSGNPVITFGLVPGSNPPLYGIQLIDPSTGNIRALLAEQADNTVSLKFFDPSGNPRTQIGELNNGDYGLAVFSTANDGTYQEIRPVVDAYASVVGSTSSTSYTTISGSPTLTVDLGASGDAVVTVSAFITLGSVAAEGEVALVINNNAPLTILAFAGAAGGAASCSSTRRLASWDALGSPGSNSFSLQYLTTAGTANFQAVSILVEPL